MSENYQTLQIEEQGFVVEIRLNRPQAKNAFDHSLHADLARAFRNVPTLPNARAILLTASGRIFSAGGDFALMLAARKLPERKEQMAADARELFEAVCLCPLPLIVALQGDAVGLGATVVLGGDAIVAARTAMISDPHVAIGLVAGDGGCVMWPQAAGLLRAKRYLLSGDRLSAEQAFAMGLVTDLVDTPDEVRHAALQLATRIAGLPPKAVQLTKAALNRATRARMDEVFEEALAGELDTFFLEDVAEAISAFQERRPGNFTGQ